jgi:predicted DCC family thiol-disulfide oxidoreductase YuxK
MSSLLNYAKTIGIKNGWTGGQYSLFRAIFGSYLFVHFAGLVPWGPELFSNRGVLPDGSASPLLHLFPNILALADSPIVVQGLLLLAAGLSLLFATGWRDRTAALLLWCLWTSFFGWNPLIANPSLPYVGWLLLAHAALPAAPYGSWAARGRADPRGSWKMLPPIFLVAWILMAAGYTYSGFVKLGSPSWVDGSALARVLENPLARPGTARDLLLALPAGLLRLATWGALALEISFAPLALFRRLRPWVWTAMMAMHLGLFLVIRFADLTAGMVMLHLFTFDPGWIAPARAHDTEWLYYDGHCGLCHRAVRFVLAEDLAGDAFRFAPLQGEQFQASVSAAEREALPDSLVVRSGAGALLTRSAAVIHILRRVGGFWRLLAGMVALIPAPLRDAAYDGVARIRYRLFARPADVCPILPAELRARFDH